MGCRKQQETEHDKQVRQQSYLPCQVCGRNVKPEECSWQEDDGEGMYCLECAAEMKSCGCSD